MDYLLPDDETIEKMKAEFARIKRVGANPPVDVLTADGASDTSTLPNGTPPPIEQSPPPNNTLPNVPDGTPSTEPSPQPNGTSPLGGAPPIEQPTPAPSTTSPSFAPNTLFLIVGLLILLSRN